MSDATDFPMQQRLKQLQGQYEAFLNQKEALICRWLLEADEFVMFDTFFDIETSNAASTPNLLLKFEASFEYQDSYSKMLFGELCDNLEDYLATPGIEHGGVLWSPPDIKVVHRDSEFSMIDCLSDFGNGISDHTDYIVALLAPQTIADDQAFINWILERLDQPWPSNVRLMILDYIDQPRFGRLSTTVPEKVWTQVPALDMSEAMKAVSAAAGKPDDPDTKFRAAFIDLTKAATKKQIKEVQSHADKAIGICVKQGWTHLHIGVLISVGSAWMNIKDASNALTSYDKAIQMAQSASNQGDDEAGVLLPTAMFAKASALIQLQDYEEAASLYEEITSITNEKDTLTMEAWRMAGFCYDQLGVAEEGYRVYQKALDTAELVAMEPEQARESTLPYVGKALFRLDDFLNNQHDRKQWSDRLDQLMGRDWNQ